MIATVASTAGQMKPPPSSVPILTYHSLDDSGSVISMAPALFRRHLEVLRARGYVGIRLGDLLTAWETRAPLPERPVVLTFDDGFCNLLDHALPALHSFGFSATVFAVAGYCGRFNDWPSQPPGIPRLPIMSMSQLRQLADQGWEVGAHGMTHAPLDRIEPSQAQVEVVQARHLLQDQLGVPVTVLAFPYGLASPASRALAARHYRGACSVRLGPARIEDERCWLPRIDMYYFRAQPLIALWGTPLGGVYLALRRWGRALLRGR